QDRHLHLNGSRQTRWNQNQTSMLPPLPIAGEATASVARERQTFRTPVAPNRLGSSDQRILASCRKRRQARANSASANKPMRSTRKKPASRVRSTTFASGPLG